MSRFYNDYDGNDLLYMEDYLEHYGRKGQKPGQHLPDVLARLMAIGHRPRRSRAQKQAVKRRRKAAKVKAKQKAQVAKKRQESLAKARAKAKENAPRRKQLDKIARTGSPAEIRKVANELSPKQRQMALDQLKFKQDINDYNDKEVKAAQAKYNSVMDRIGKFAETSGKVLDAASKGYKFYSDVKGGNAKLSNLVDANNNNKKQGLSDKDKKNAASDLSDVFKQAGKFLADEEKKK